jgi:hypothetical protein
LPGRIVIEGNAGHLEARRTTPADEPGTDVIIEQRCSPLRRQQGGSFESGSGRDSAGPISDQLKTANSNVAGKRCTVS